MKMLFLSLCVLALAIWAGVTLHNETSFVLIAYGNTSIEMPLWFFILGIALIGGSIFIVFKILSSIFNAPMRLGHFYQQKKITASRTKMRQGFIALAEGRWKEAEKLLLKSTAHLNNTLLPYLGSAIAAQQLGALDRRDNYLRLAHGTKDADVAVSLTQARLQIEQGQLEQGLATLQLLRQLSPQHDYVLTLLKDVYTSLGEWNALLELVYQLKQRKLISDKEAEKLQVLAQSMILKTASAQGLSALEATWYKMDRHLKHNTELVTEYVTLLSQQHRPDLVQNVLQDQLKHVWDDKLARLYGLTLSKDPAKQLAQAETWLKTHPQNAMLLLTLGRLSMATQQWDKARTYLEKSAELNPCVETYIALAQLSFLFPTEKISAQEYIQKAQRQIEENI